MQERNRCGRCRHLQAAHQVIDINISAGNESTKITQKNCIVKRCRCTGYISELEWVLMNANKPK